MTERGLDHLYFSIVGASTPAGVIGVDNDLPWQRKLTKDLKRFKKITDNGILIMGYRTAESLRTPILKNRISIVLTTRLNVTDSTSPITSKCNRNELPDLHFSNSLENALTLARELLMKRKYVGDGSDKIFVIGGRKLFDEAILHSRCRHIYWTRVYKEYAGDGLCKVTNQIDNSVFDLVKLHNIEISETIPYQFFDYERRHEEYQVIKILHRLLNSGVHKTDRTGTGTHSIFGTQMRFSLANGFIPILTTKRVFFKTVVAELLWMISGSTDADKLKQQGVHIWEKDTSRETLDKRGFKTRREGDIGPGYGFQMRHFGAKYTDCSADYSGAGVDQLTHIINTIKTDPHSRRIILNLWNPVDIPNSTLPPCHILAQFYVIPDHPKGKLCCQMYQRSVDFFLGFPYNIAFYSLLTHMIAMVCDLEAGEFIHCGGDVHLYKNHFEQAQIQVSRLPKQFPIIKLLNKRNNLNEFETTDFELSDYDPHPAIKGDISV